MFKRKFLSYLVSSQIWLNLPVDYGHVCCYTTKLTKTTTAPSLLFRRIFHGTHTQIHWTLNPEYRVWIRVEEKAKMVKHFKMRWAWIEHATFRSSVWRSPNWAIPAYHNDFPAHEFFFLSYLLRWLFPSHATRRLRRDLFQELCVWV